MAALKFLGIVFSIALVRGGNMRSVELVYDAEAAQLANGVRKFISISGCFFECLNGQCSISEGETDNFCMLIAVVLTKKQGNLRQGHFDSKVGWILCKSWNNGN